MEQWQINRAGVINFWYYDDEAFEFEDGRLLLRGSNGSGKSVTMQSLVPLLFDGNKSPERLDPFGSRARKMESYLLSDGLNLEERTGYLFLEFAKPKDGRYMTIGMGMRARKNMQMQTWYFIILDNRRVGHEYDLSLYKEIGNKLPLTQKELENRIGSGGKLYTRQKDYKAAVNEYLFGYEDLTDFEELIELLLQIRSPKLSKEFKPTTMYEIMQNSLITLTDDDLRPMSEAIENMDDIKIKIEALENSKKALGRIDTAYTKYNQFMIADKSKRYLDYTKKVEDVLKKLKELKGEYTSNSHRLNQLEQEINANKEEEQQLKKKEESLKEHDLSKLATEKIILTKKVSEGESEIKKKKEQLEKHEERERCLIENRKKKQYEQETVLDKIVGELDEMKDFAEEAEFDEHMFMIDEYERSKEVCYKFDYHKNQLSAYKSRVKIGESCLREMESKNMRHEEMLEALDEITKKKHKQENMVKSYERQLNGIKEEFAEHVFAWAKDNAVLTVEKSVLNETTERVYQYGERYGYDEVIEPVRVAYEAIRNRINSQKSQVHGKKALKEEELDLRIKELEACKAKKEPEPERTQQVRLNRQRLEEKGIPFMPLYKALDFNKDMNEALKGTLEAGFVDLGILDALIVEPSYKNEVLVMDKGMSDKYIFADPEMLSHNLSTYLQPDKDSGQIGSETIGDILESILLDKSTNKFYISEDGTYGMGIISGKTSGLYESKFIGYQSRKRYKEQLIDKMNEIINGIKAEINKLQEEIDANDSLLNVGESEWQQFPNKIDLDVAYKDLNEQQDQLNRIIKESEELSKRMQIVYEALKALQIEVHEKTKGITLAKQSVVFGKALEDLEGYQQLFQEFMGLDQTKWHIMELLVSIEDQYNQCLFELDDVRYDINKLDNQLSHSKSRLYNIEQELAISDYQDIIKQLELCKSRLEKLPNDYKVRVEERATIVASNQTIKNEGEQIAHQRRALESLKELYEKAFSKELDLGYIEMNEEDMALKLKAKNVYKVYGTCLEGDNTIIQLRDQLNDKYLKEIGELAEYNLKRIDLFRDITVEVINEETMTGEVIERLEEERIYIERIDIVARMQGRQVKFYEMIALLDRQISENGSLLDEQDRILFEEILIKSVSRKISSKIYHSEKWVKMIDDLMNQMNTSSGLNFNLRWVTKQAESEDQLSTKELVDILKGEQSLLSKERRDSLIKHFRSKIQESKNRVEDSMDQRSFLSVMKEILDYRKWFEFKLYFTKKGDKKKELTNNAFFTFSGGEKAMAMYVPLFSAVYAKYQGGNKDCPKIISLDEAFAGVDEKNIQDMFKLLVELDLGFIANSQVLFGDYETVPALSIYELVRPENVTYVTLIRYKWNGKIRKLVT